MADPQICCWTHNVDLVGKTRSGRIRLNSSARFSLLAPLSASSILRLFMRTVDLSALHNNSINPNIHRVMSSGTLQAQPGPGPHSIIVYYWIVFCLLLAAGSSQMFANVWVLSVDNCLKSPDYKTQYRNSRLQAGEDLLSSSKVTEDKAWCETNPRLHTSCRAKQRRSVAGLAFIKTSVSLFKLLKRWDNISIICKHSEHLNTKYVLPPSSSTRTTIDL